MKKRIISLVLCGILFMSSSGSVYAAEISSMEEPEALQEETTEEAADTSDTETSGVCGENLTWNFENQVLTISGSGAMSNYAKGNAPWYSFINNADTSVELILDSEITSIGNYAFYDCNSLEEAELPENCTSVGISSFSNCNNISRISWGNSLAQIGAYAFSGCSALSEVEKFPESLTKIEMSAFFGCSSWSGELTLPSSLTTIGSYAFAHCTGLTGALIIPDSVTDIQSYAFFNCSGFTSLKLSENLTDIVSAFPGCSGLTGKVVIPDKVTRITSYSFQNCSGITEFVFGSGLTSMNAFSSTDSNAFLGCTAVGKVTFLNETPPESGNMSSFLYPFSDMEQLKVIYVPKGSYEAYYKCFGDYLSESTVILEIGQQIIELNTSSATIEAGETLQLTIRFTPSEASADKKLIWKSSDSQIASITDNGLVTAQKPGTAVITCAVLGEETVSAQCELTVTGHTEHIWSDWETIISTATPSKKIRKCIINGCETSESTNIQPGWLKFEGKWYYLNNSGQATTGWQKISGTWYYMNSNGAMQTGWLKISGTWYYMNSSGAMQTGWLKTGGQWYYLSSSGAMQTGWLKISGTWYYMNSNGAMQTGWLKTGGQWYYLSSSGAMQTGWKVISGKYYYMYPSGVMASNTRINGYYVDASGIWVPGR